MKRRIIALVILANSTLLLAASCPITNEAPVASFSVFPASGVAPLDVIFDASDSFDSDGYITVYRWNAGDGATTSGSDAIIHHVYDTPGIYAATLRVTDDSGASDTATHTIIVDAPSSKLEILDWQLQPHDNMFMPWVIIGHAKNVSGKTLSYAQVNGQFYDAQNVLLSSWMDNMSNLPAGVTWEFHIYLVDSEVGDRVHHADVQPGTCL